MESMNIISASRRTDIPAWYGSWLMARVRAGRAAYRNPFSGERHEVSLLSHRVIAFVFWTRNAAPFMHHLETLLASGYRSYFQYTLNGYGNLLEAGVPPRGRALKAFRALSDRLGPKLVRWRYDPILMAPNFDRDYHLKAFTYLAARLEGYTEVCHVSFVQFYRKTQRSFAALEKRSGIPIQDPEDGEKVALTRELAALAAARGIRLESCCYPLLSRAGLPTGRCVDPELIRELRPDLASLRLRARPSREGCGCVESRDIGAYDTCPGACIYCYATQNPERAKDRFAKHDSDSECLG